MPLQSVEAPRLYRRIADQLRQLIAAGEFPPGERLPAERELAAQLKVSRPSVREALIALEVEGLIEIRGGSGVYVRARPNGTNRAGSSYEWGPLELIRARALVEGEVAALAARQAKRVHVAAMQAAVDAMRAEAAAGRAPLAGDRAFHVAVAEATGNGVLVDLVARFWDARGGRLFQRLGNYFDTPTAWRAAIEEHAAVLQAIRARDPARARQAMQRHLQKAHARFSASWRKARGV
ncbi:MAG: FadR/GntR family transcriptional regulator [Sutterellaceae bacterium]|nr:FadR family transcriptional regulator [Burkholderiaceae bacterium]MCX7902306.1 FadR family transcriptional regulator [Burkholderiaceae bacterium]MDW8428931.1 FadR/GntR family transcriptional regulator [Sutterellaceae bacterium]